MKIIDWENIIRKKYYYTKIYDLNTLKKYFTEQQNGELYGLLKKDEDILYLITNDNIHLSSTLSEDYKNIFKHNIDYQNQKNQWMVELKDYISYFESVDFKFISAKDATKKDLEYYESAQTVSSSALTDGEIPDEEFYAFYVFNDDEVLHSRNNITQVAGFFTTTIIMIGSKDKVNIDNIYTLDTNNINDPDFIEFLRYAKIKKVNGKEFS